LITQTSLPSPQQDDDASEEIPLHDEPANGNTPAKETSVEEAPAASDPLSLLTDTTRPFPSESPKFASRPPSGADSYGPLSSENGLENIDLGPLHEEIDLGVDGGGNAPPPSSSSAASAAAITDRGNLLFSPSGAGTSGASTSAAAAGVSTRPAARIRISVSDPVRRVSDHAFIPGLTSSHFEYLVTSAPILPVSNGHQSSPTTTAPAQQHQEAGNQAIDDQEPWQRREVRRRFNDFVALADLLVETQRGYFIFPRPDKGALDGAASGKSEIEFVESRRVELERYLRRLAEHPVLGKCNELRVFLTAEGSLSSNFHWQQLQPLKASLMEGVARLPAQLLGSDPVAPTTADAAKNPKHTNDLLRRLKELGERMRQEYKPPMSLPEDEIALRQTKAEVESYSEVLMQASRRAEKLLREFEHTGNVIGDLGLSLVRLGKYEDEEGSKCGEYTELGAGARAIGTEARRVGMTAVRTFRLARSATNEAVSALEPLHTELALAPAVVEALKEREAALVTVDTIRDGISKKAEALSIAEQSTDLNQVRKAQALRNEIASLEAACDAAEAEYEKVKGRNQTELQRWREERKNEFTRMAVAYAHVMAVFEDRAAEVFRSTDSSSDIINK
jgi:sorting nexin-1/2